MEIFSATAETPLKQISVIFASVHLHTQCFLFFSLFLFEFCIPTSLFFFYFHYVHLLSSNTHHCQ